MAVMLGGAAVLWRVVMHRSPSISPAESEFYGLSTGVCETLHIRQLMEELGHVFTTATQVTTNPRVRACIGMVRSPKANFPKLSFRISYGFTFYGMKGGAAGWSHTPTGTNQ